MPTAAAILFRAKKILRNGVCDKERLRAIGDLAHLALYRTGTVCREARRLLEDFDENGVGSARVTGPSYRRRSHG